MALLTYTYELDTPVGQTRLYAADTTVDGINTVWADEELTVFLSQVGGKPELAAAKALRTAASDASKVAVITRLGQLGNDETKLPDELRKQADALELACLQKPAVGTPRHHHRFEERIW